MRISDRLVAPESRWRDSSGVGYRKGLALPALPQSGIEPALDYEIVALL